MIPWLTIFVLVNTLKILLLGEHGIGAYASDRVEVDHIRKTKRNSVVITGAVVATGTIINVASAILVASAVPRTVGSAAVITGSAA
jgi:hypothetical protein